MPLAVERDARAEMARRVVPRLRFEDFLRIDELVALELGAHQRGRAFDAGRRGSGLIRRRGASARCCGAVTRLRVAQVDEVVLREVRVHGDFLHAALALRAHGGHSGHRRRQQLAAADDAQRAGVIAGAALRDEHVAVRQPSHAPRIAQAFGDRHDLEGLAGRAGRLRQRGSGNRQRRGGDEPRGCTNRRSQFDVAFMDVPLVERPRASSKKTALQRCDRSCPPERASALILARRSSRKRLESRREISIRARLTLRGHWGRLGSGVSYERSQSFLAGCGRCGARIRRVRRVTDRRRRSA